MTICVCCFSFSKRGYDDSRRYLPGLFCGGFSQVTSCEYLIIIQPLKRCYSHTEQVHPPNQRHILRHVYTYMGTHINTCKKQTPTCTFINQHLHTDSHIYTTHSVLIALLWALILHLFIYCSDF